MVLGTRNYAHGREERYMSNYRRRIASFANHAGKQPNSCQYWPGQFVQYVTVREAPDFRFSNLGNDVFILTTLSAHHSSLEEINSIIRGLCEAHVAAIAIKLGRFVYEY
jgi:hypothetical protein